jgi:hypothetical protein
LAVEHSKRLSDQTGELESSDLTEEDPVDHSDQERETVLSFHTLCDNALNWLFAPPEKPR